MMSQWASLKGRAAGKWQMPLLLLSLIMLAASFHRLQPTRTRLSPDQAIEQLNALILGELYDRAIEFGNRLLTREEYSSADRALVHLPLARARYGAAQGVSGRPSSRSIDKLESLSHLGRQIIEHYQHAESHPSVSGVLTGSDYENMGRAFEWQERFSTALEHYKKALDRGVKHPLDLRSHMISLTLNRLDTPPERASKLLDEFLAEAGDHRLDLRLWAIEKKLDLYEAIGRLDEAATLLTRERDRFHASDLRDRFQYWEAWLLYMTGHFDEAGTHLRTVRNRVAREDDVHAMTGWLLGRVVMSDGGPQRPLEALSFFSDVITYHQSGPYVVASRVGSAEALAVLERQQEAIAAYQVAIEELETLTDQRLVNRDVLRTSLGVTADAQRRAGRLPEAVEYARLAVALVDRGNVELATSFLQQLGQTQSLLAVQLDEQSADPNRPDVRRDQGAVVRREPSERTAEASSQEARAMFAEAAATYLDLGQINVLNEQRAAESSWRAAELYARAGERDRAAKLYRTFATERPQNSLVPRALLRIGQLRQASGQLPAAVEAYRECYRRFPRTLDGSRVLIPLVQCYLAMGPDYEDLAEKALLVVLEQSEVFTPQAPEFADALFLLGDALNRRGSFERAIGALEEALERYPDDQRVLRARFLLAESYRRSGLALKAEIAEAKLAGEIEQMRAEFTARLQAAQQLYRRLITDYELRDPATLNRLEKVYLRHAYLYEADCYFETRDYRRALKLYEEAVGIYKERPSALAAYVQIINSHVFLGQPAEARAALARGLVLVDAMPDEAFDNVVSPETRQDWKRYLEWLGRSELF